MHYFTYFKPPWMSYGKKGNDYKQYRAIRLLDLLTMGNFEMNRITSFQSEKILTENVMILAFLQQKSSIICSGQEVLTFLLLLYIPLASSTSRPASSGIYFPGLTTTTAALENSLGFKNSRKHPSCNPGWLQEGNSCQIVLENNLAIR